MKIIIVLPYPGAEQMTAIWSEEERVIDFRRDFARAVRCTTAFAAMELKRHLDRSLTAPEIGFACTPPADIFHIALKLEESGRPGDDGFRIEPAENSLTITGFTRAGLLYGAYEVLRMQGWRWYAPGTEGDISPEKRDALALPDGVTEYHPAFTLGRGFDFENLSMESRELSLWMARNRLNLGGFRAETAAFCRKLGMTFKIGGHIFEKILDPDRIMSSGRTLWEDHPDWFGLPEKGERVKANAQRVQFCVSQDGLIEFLADELIKQLRGPWKEADRIDVWGFDTWGSICACEKCRTLGNGSDRNLYFISKMRDAVNRAGIDVKLVMCLYEGTSSMQAPLGPIPENLLSAGDHGVFYPINRCYSHDFNDRSCEVNAKYDGPLAGWLGQKPHLPIMVGEYYNVSKFEDLPILFTARIAHDIPHYRACGAEGMTYMHIPMLNWGMRTLTQLLYAQMLWDTDTDVPAFLDEYFNDRYGPHAEKMKQAYDLIEEAWEECAGWRAWSDRSVLSRLIAWNGKTPDKPLTPGYHFESGFRAVASGRKSLQSMKQAMELIDGARKADNPRALEMRLGEDRRLLIYGIDTMRLMTALTEYHDALVRGDAGHADACLNEAENVADRLDSYFVPIGYEWPGPGFVSKDALTRTQLRDLLAKCRRARLETAGN